MTRALVWKELREQWPIWLALAVVAAGASAGLFALISPGPNRDEMLTAVLWLTAWGYGLVCGALLLAGEAEGETQPFLDSLPGSRPRIWRVKAATGLLLLAAQFAALLAIGFLLFRERYGHSRDVFDLAGMLLFGVVGYAWGLYCGSSASNVLGAIARAVLLQVAWSVGLFLAVALVNGVYVRAGGLYGPGAVVLGVMVLIAAGVTARSRTIYCQPDWLRAEALRPRGRKPAWKRWSGPFREACWEVRWFALGMGLYGLAGMAGLAFLGVASWPALTLVLGVLCGVTALAGERGWVVRAVVRAAIGVGSAGIMTLLILVPYAIHADSESAGLQVFFSNRVSVSAITALASHPTLFLTLWPAEGFACGLLAGFVYRKRLAVAAAGLLLACLFGGIWLPTVYTGGNLHAWQMWLAPAIFLIAIVVLAYSRAAGRLTAARRVVVTGCAILAAGSATAAALWNRAYEMPPVPDAVDVEAFKATLPGPGQNAGGERMSQALLRLTQLRLTFDNEALRPPAVGGPPTARRQFFQFTSDAEAVTTRGWKAADPELADFLDRMFAREWAFELADAARLPTGLLVDPREVTFSTVSPQLPTASSAATLLTARGLQLQAGGQPEAFVDNLQTGLAVVRSMRHTSVSLGALRSPQMEATMSRGVERWLERLDGRPDLLRRALATLLEHLDAPLEDPERIRQTEFLITLNTVADPANIPRRGEGTDPFFPSALNDSPLLRVAWETPWEKVRLRRVLEGLASGDPHLRELAKELTPPTVKELLRIFSNFFGPGAVGTLPRNLYPLRVAALQVALRLFQAEEGRPADKLGELVPKYLRAVPADPYDGQPFRYRLSRGETLDWPPDDFQLGPGKTYDFRKVPAGQGILWSVGDNKQDDGGRVQQQWHPAVIFRAEDRIALVPLPPGAR